MIEKRAADAPSLSGRVDGEQQQFGIFNGINGIRRGRPGKEAVLV